MRNTFTLPKGRKLSQLPRQQQIVLVLNVATTEADAVADLGHALAADLVRAAVAHGVGARIDSLRFDWVSGLLTLKQYDRIERKARRNAQRIERIIQLCEDGDADQMTQEAARLAKLIKKEGRA